MDGLETKDNVQEAEIAELAAPDQPRSTKTPSAAAAHDPLARRPESAPAPAAPGKIFAADVAEGDDALGLAPRLAPLAELALHRDTETPLVIGLFGGPGAGKSFALRRLIAAIDGLSEATARTDDAAGPPAMSLRLDALALGEAPGEALAGALHDALAARFAELAREAGHAVRHPLLAAREAAEDLDATRHKLDAERHTLTEVEGRRAELLDKVLFEQPGAGVNVYARANRAKIENRLRGFGVTGEPLQSYQSMVRDLAEPGGFFARIGAGLYALWAFRGQMRLLMTAVCLGLLAWGCDFAFDHEDAWPGFLRGLGHDQAFVPLADWLAAHLDWLGLIKAAALAGAGLALVVDLFRALRFLAPLFRGVDLLQAEVAHRRQELDQLYAHQMQRVDALVADLELKTRHAAEADRRAARVSPTRLAHRIEASPFETQATSAPADRFFTAVATAIAHQGAIAAPRRLVVGLDNIDRLPAPKAAALLDAIARSLAQPGFVTLIAADPQRLSTLMAPGDRDDAACLERLVQIPFRLREGLGKADFDALVAQAAGQDELRQDTAWQDEAPPPHDWTLAADETKLLTELAPFAAQSPRGVKRFVNLYRLARLESQDGRPLLAFMLALDQGGSGSDRAVVAEVLARGPGDADFALVQGSEALRSALDCVCAAQGRRTVEAARRAAALAQIYSLRD